MTDAGPSLYRVGVTGTNGKTSITSFVAQIARACGVEAAAVGQRIELPGRTESRNVVSRRAGGLAAYFRELEEAGIGLVACEVYSAAVGRGAHRDLGYQAAVFHNLATDHHAVHGSVARYQQVKLSFLDSLRPGTPAVIPQDARGEAAILKRARAARLDVRRPAHRRPGRFPRSPFLESNLAVAMEVCLIAGLPPAGVVEAAADVKLPPGRMVRRHLPNGARVVVDFAHNAHALRAVLRQLREETPGEVHVVFGSKGGWGAEKRQEMGDAVAALAGHVIVTDDDPRYEDPAVIRHQLRRSHPFRIIAGRGRAIRTAMSALEPEDTLLVAGRGEDPCFVESFGRRSFNDLAIVEAVIRTMTGGGHALSRTA